MYSSEPQISSFGEGFRDGYMSVANGGNGCVPALPPRNYWSWRYQSLEGQAKVAAWYAGFPYGAAAAEEDGAANYQMIQVSNLIEAQYSPDFQNGICPCDSEGMYPDWFPPEYLPPSEVGEPNEAIRGNGPEPLRAPLDSATGAFDATRLMPDPAVYLVPPPGPNINPITSRLGGVIPASATIPLNPINR